MLQKMVDQIYRLKVPMPFEMGEVNSYLLKGEKGFTVVDTGDNTEEAKAVWTRMLTDSLPIEKIVLTHAHPDHIGLAGWFQREFNVPIWMSTNGYEELLKSRNFFIDEKYTSPFASFSLLHGGILPTERGEQYYKFDTFQFEPTMLFEEQQEITLGDSIYETIWTPGHTSDHFCFYNRETQILLAGDHILKSMNPVVGSEQLGDNPMKDYLHSLDKIAECQTNYVLPGHGDPIIDLAARIEDMKIHYKKRWKQTYNSVREEGSTAFQVSKSVYAGLSQERFRPAFIQTITNLNYLESLGHVMMEEHNGKIYYYKVPIT